MLALTPRVLRAQGLAAVGRARRLRELVVSECVGITDVGVQKFAQQCKQIEALDISLCKALHSRTPTFPQRCHPLLLFACAQQVTDAGVKALAFSTRLLVKLNVAGCKQVLIRSRLVYRIIFSNACMYTKLYFKPLLCSQVTDLSIQYLTGVCRYLRYLDVSGCILLSYGPHTHMCIQYILYKTYVT